MTPVDDTTLDLKYAETVEFTLLTSAEKTPTKAQRQELGGVLHQPAWLCLRKAGRSCSLTWSPPGSRVQGPGPLSSAPSQSEYTGPRMDLGRHQGCRRRGT